MVINVHDVVVRGVCLFCRSAVWWMSELFGVSSLHLRRDSSSSAAFEECSSEAGPQRYHFSFFTCLFLLTFLPALLFAYLSRISFNCFLFPQCKIHFTVEIVYVFTSPLFVF